MVVGEWICFSANSVQYLDEKTATLKSNFPMAGSPLSGSGRVAVDNNKKTAYYFDTCELTNCRFVTMLPHLKQYSYAYLQVNQTMNIKTMQFISNKIYATSIIVDNSECAIWFGEVNKSSGNFSKLKSIVSGIGRIDFHLIRDISTSYNSNENDLYVAYVISDTAYFATIHLSNLEMDGPHKLFTPFENLTAVNIFYVKKNMYAFASTSQQSIFGIIDNLNFYFVRFIENILYSVAYDEDTEKFVCMTGKAILPFQERHSKIITLQGTIESNVIFEPKTRCNPIFQMKIKD